ncbi:hypothetical protein ACSVIJ_16970 [Pseudomonas sp. NCHU5208]|uniref:hypothetical protein n=1 Tax=unclassified Pseudomonas TaxID=196821 RepID=UPI003F9B9DC7
MQSLRSPYNPLHIVLGLVLWSLWFVALYGGLSLGCAAAPPPAAQGPWNWLNALLGVMSLLTLLVLLWLARHFQLAARRSVAGSVQGFIARLAASVHLVGAIATLFIGLTTLLLPPCI